MHALPAPPSHWMNRWGKGPKGQGRPGELVHDTPGTDLDNAPFRWIRAPEAVRLRSQRMRRTGALVLVAAALSTQMLHARLDGQQAAGRYIQNIFLALPSPPSIAAPAKAVASALVERFAGQVPMLATAPTNVRALETATVAPQERRSPSRSTSQAVARNPRLSLASREHANQSLSLATPGVSEAAAQLPAMRIHASRQDSKLPPVSASAAPAANFAGLRDFVLGSRWYALQVARNPRATY